MSGARVRGEDADSQQGILASSAVMAAGTVLSRLSGFVRSALLVVALGSVLHADIFNTANVVPNMLYILLAGGVFNAVLVPQLVRAMTQDPDGGEAYTNRVVTAAGLFLLTVTVVLVVAAPLVMAPFISGFPPDAQESAVDFARFCLPQVFLYGMFVLLGQVLNARRRFGPMMWAPIANNVIAVGVLVVYLLVFGPASEAEQVAAYDGSQELLLGLGSTLGIAVQLLILIPYVRAAGFRYRPRFDLRGTGLGHTLRLGLWTVLFVVVNQAAYVVVVFLANGGTASGSREATGYTVYSSSFLLTMVPHAVVTVSLATAVLPLLSRQAGEGDLAGLGRSLGATMRTALVVVVPFAALLPLVALPLSRVVFGLGGAGGASYDNFAPSLALFGPGLVAFTVHYLVLRGFYALERNRTVFLVQCVVSATNVVVALLLVAATDDRGTSPALVGAYSAAYVVGACLSFAVLHRQLGDLGDGALPGFLARLGAAVLVATAAAGLLHLVLPGGSGDPGRLAALGHLAAVSLLDVGVFLLVARLLRLDEVTSVLATVTRRVRSPRG